MVSPEFAEPLSPSKIPVPPSVPQAATERPAESVSLDRVHSAEEREQSKTGTGDFKQLRVRRCPVPFLRAALTATDFYVRLLGWARRSGLPRATAETASELAARLQGRFPPLAATIAAIVKAYNEEAYREVGPGPAGLAELGAAWRELRRVAHWPTRLHAWWTASAEPGQAPLPIPANRPRSHPT